MSDPITTWPGELLEVAQGRRRLELEDVRVHGPLPVVRSPIEPIEGVDAPDQVQPEEQPEERPASTAPTHGREEPRLRRASVVGSVEVSARAMFVAVVGETDRGPVVDLQVRVRGNVERQVTIRAELLDEVLEMLGSARAELLRRHGSGATTRMTLRRPATRTPSNASAARTGRGAGGGAGVAPRGAGERSEGSKKNNPPEDKGGPGPRGVLGHSSLARVDGWTLAPCRTPTLETKWGAFPEGAAHAREGAARKIADFAQVAQNGGKSRPNDG